MTELVHIKEQPDTCLKIDKRIYYHYVRLQIMDVGVCYSKRLHWDIQIDRIHTRTIYCVWIK